MSELRGSEMVFVGIDLAWGARNRTGVVAAAGGSVVDSRSVVSDDQICDCLDPYMGCPVLVAVDAPLVVRNPAGTSRPCDRKISRVFGATQAGAHSANLGLAAFSGGVRAERLARRMGLSIDPYIEPGQPVRRMIEVYPHPAMVSLFGLSYTLKYKAKRGRSVDDRQTGVRRPDCAPREANDFRPATLGRDYSAVGRACGSLVLATSNGQLDLIEDELDAYMCAYIGFYYWTHGASCCRVVGDVDTGYIVTPVAAAFGAALDAVVLEAPIRRMRKDGVVLRHSTNAIPVASTPAPQIAPAPAGQCGCGCGRSVRNRYQQGHDARHKEGLIRAALAGQVEAEARLAELGWSKFLEPRRASGRWG